MPRWTLNILALDLGSQMGWAVTNRAGDIISGSEPFQYARHKSHGARFLAFMAFLNDLRTRHDGFHAVYFEDVKNHSGVLAAHSYGGFLAILQVWCKVNNVHMTPFGVGKIKQAWTGKGNADKEKMIAAARQRGFDPVDDNAADALAILMLACQAEGRPFPEVRNKPTGALL